MRPHSSVDLTQQGTDPASLLNGITAHEGTPLRAAASRGRNLVPSTSMQSFSEAQDYRGHGGGSAAVGPPNGYTAGYSMLDQEEGLRQWQRQELSGASATMRPYSASSPRYESRPVSRPLSHDSLADPNGRALLAELHRVRASMGTAEGGRHSRQGFMTPPPPPPPRTPPLSSVDPALSQIERQGSFQVCLNTPTNLLEQNS